jgi:hypothetical protein
MKTTRNILLLSILFILSGYRLAFSQSEEIEGYDSISDRVLLKKELTGGITIHNLGMGGNIRKGVNKTFFNSRIFELELVSMKHPKQVRMINPYYYQAKSFVYGKLNYVLILRASYGFKKLLNRKPYWGGIELRALYMGGVSVAFAKPVYLVFWDETITYTKVERYNPDNPFHDEEYIFGRARFAEGIGEIKVYPGIFVKGGLNFEFGTLNSKIRALEVGAVAEYFPVAIPIMAYNPEQSFFFTFYLNFSLGKRYN